MRVTRRVWVVFLVFALLAAGVAGYSYWRPRKLAIPVISTERMDPEVAAAIGRAQAELEAHPDSAAAWGLLGKVLFGNDLYAESVGVFAEAERLDPTDARWPYFRGLALILKMPDEGIAALKRASALQRRTPALRLRLAEEYLKLDRIDEAESLFGELLDENPGNPRVLLGHGLVLSRRGRWQEALAPLRTAADDPTAQKAARTALVDVQLHLGDTAAAESEGKLAAAAPEDRLWLDPYLTEAREHRTGLQPRIEGTLQRLSAGRSDEALALASDLLRDHPDSVKAHLTMAKVLIRTGDFTAAERELGEAIRRNPGLIEGHLLLGGTRLQNKDYEGAARCYQRAIDLQPSHGVAYYNLGDCRLKQGDKAGAIIAFRNALRCRPDLSVAQVELGGLLLGTGELEEAIAHLQDAVRLDSKNERAEKLLQQALEKKEIVISYQLSVISYQLAVRE